MSLCTLTVQLSLCTCCTGDFKDRMPDMQSSAYLDSVGVILLNDLQNIKAVAVRLLLANGMGCRQTLAEGSYSRQQRPQVPYLLAL